MARWSPKMWQVRTGMRFTTIIGAELSYALWTERGAYCVTAAGLPLDFEVPAPEAECGRGLQPHHGCGRVT